jgi:hypothetical protein
MPEPFPRRTLWVPGFFRGSLELVLLIGPPMLGRADEARGFARVYPARGRNLGMMISLSSPACGGGAERTT